MSRILRKFSPALALAVFAGAASAQTCSVSISPTTVTNVPAAGQAAVQVINVTSPAGCQWTATSSVPWVVIQYGQSGTQNGSVGFTVLAQDSNTSRTGTITINDKTFTVTQSAGSCQYQLLSNGVPISSSSFPAEGGSGSVDLSTLRGCAWQVTTLSSWISILTPSGSGPGTISFSVAPATGSRTGSITVQSERLTISQAAPCSFSASSPPPVSGNGATVSVTVTASSTSCSRDVRSQVDWIVINNPTATGNTAISITVKPNTTTSARIGNIQINDTIIPIAQNGNTCQFTLVPASATALQTGGVGTIAVQTQSGCVWTATPAPGSDWLRITGTASGTGNGTVAYAIGQNLDASQRTGFINIGSGTFRVIQAGLGCTIRVENTNLAVSSDGGSGTFTVSALTSCNWQVSSDAPWLKITSGGDGSGPADVTFTADPNPTSQVRVARVLVGATTVTITQGAGNCKITLGQTSLSIASAGGAGQVSISANCGWSATSSVEWIRISNPAGNSDGTVQFQVLANTGADDRTGTITIAGQAVTITQTGQRCSLTVAPTNATIPARGGNGSFSVTGGSSCTWSPTGAASWLTTSFTAVNGSGTVRYNAAPNTTGQDRQTVVSVSGQQVTITQPAIRVTVSVDGVLNAATFAGGAVAPGEIITIYGAGFGPALLANLELTTNRQNITSAIGDTRVLFDGVPSPMVYVVDGQLSAIVPYAVAGKTTTAMEVEYLGVRSNAVTLQVAATAPGIFTLTQNGKGQGAVLNQDSSLNGPGSAAAQRNTIIQIFATGEGQTRPVGVDGKLAVAPLPTPVAPVRVFVGGVEATVTYAGQSTGLVAGLVQVNARIPANAPVGDAVALEVRFNNVASPAGVTIGVRQ